MQVVTYLIKYLKLKCKNINKIYIYIMVASIVLAVFSFIANKDSIFYKNNVIRRSNYGGIENKYNLKVNIGDVVKNENIDFLVSNKRYTNDEIQQIFEYAFDECILKVLGKNSDFEHITTDFNYFSEYKNGIYVVWDFKLKNDNDFSYIQKYYSLVDDYGIVHNEIIDEDSVSGYLEFYLKGYVENNEKMVRSDSYLVPVNILKKERTEKEKLLDDLNSAIKYNNKNTITTDYINLPNIIDNKKITYIEKKDFSFMILPIFGIIVIVLLELRDKNNIKEKEKQKKRELLIIYPNLISKLLIYVSSGMAIRNSLCQVAIDYKKRFNSKIEKQNIVFDKLVELKNNLDNGMIENTAYEKMAKELNDAKYSRFFNILIQSINNGSKDFKNILEIEAYDSLMEKKNIAKKLGEEASTKLVIPLLLELLIVMFVIIVPAFMGI